MKFNIFKSPLPSREALQQVKEEVAKHANNPKLTRAQREAYKRAGRHVKRIETGKRGTR